MDMDFTQGDVVVSTDLPGLELVNRGKVRDIYKLDQGLLIIATDRISAFDVVIPTPIPGKGKVLTQLSLFWFDFLKDVCGNHLITSDVNDMPDPCPSYSSVLDARSMLVKRAEVLPVECIVRGYISGSGWKSYQKDNSICGISLPPGLKESDKLPEPIFTPSTKAEQGLHDENISFERMKDIIGDDLAEKVRDLSLTIYNKASEYAIKRGIIIADTKFEFGLVDGELILVDECLTPDSSRFWPKDQYAPGGPQPSFDKQFVRDYLESVGWAKTPPAPELPEEIVVKTQERYIDAFKLLTADKIS